MNVVIETGVQFWATLSDMAPYLLFGFLMAGILSVLISTAFVERHLGGTGLWAVVKASLFGVPLPLCSCSVIPVAASLRRHGASKGATTAFLLSTPQTGADSIMATFSLLGPVFAVFRPFAAFVSGILGGALVQRLATHEKDEPAPDRDNEACCCGTQRSSKVARIFRYGFLVLPQDIAGSLLVGILIAGVIAVLVPDGFFAEVLGTGFIAMLVMMLLGIPVYVCATASIPVAAAMMLKGVTPGAALVFLMTGPATNAATVATLWRMFGRRTAMLYLAAVAATALGSGLVLDAFFTIVRVRPGAEMAMLPEWLKTLSACVLLVVLALSFLAQRRRNRPIENE